MAVRPWGGEGRLHNYNYWQYLGGEVGSVWGGGVKVSCLEGKVSCLGGNAADPIAGSCNNYTSL